MPSVRALILGVIVTLAVGSIVLLWLRAPWPIALVTGGVFGTGFLSIATSLGDDSDEADAAWRADAADLLERSDAVPPRPDPPPEVGR